jgi:hypothetical protein
MVAEPRIRRHRRHVRRGHEAETSSASLFGNWFAPKAEARRMSRRKTAQR